MSTKTETTKPATQVTTGLVRLSYVALFEPKAGPNGGKEKYSVSLIIPKSDTETLAKINAAIVAAEKEGLAGKWEGKKPKVYKDPPLRDGDDTDDEAYADSFYINAKNDRKPGIVGMERDADNKLKRIEDVEEVYSGCYGRASVTAYAFNANGNKGIAWSLDNVQKIKDGERLGGGGRNADADFEDDFEDDGMFD